ncbi:hypothetical protein BDFB_014578, partial [Asbolus verrucosus]
MKLTEIASGENESTWDIVRNAELKKLLKDIEENIPDLWKDELPTREHMQVIFKIRKNVSKFEEKLGSEENDLQRKVTGIIEEAKGSLMGMKMNPQMKAPLKRR